MHVTLQHGCSPVNLLLIFRTPFRNNNPPDLWKYIFKTAILKKYYSAVLILKFSGPCITLFYNVPTVHLLNVVLSIAFRQNMKKENKRKRKYVKYVFFFKTKYVSTFKFIFFSNCFFSWNAERKVEERTGWFYALPEKIKGNQRPGSSNIKIPTCRFFKELEFLKDSVKIKPTTSNVNIVNNSGSGLDHISSYHILQYHLHRPSLIQIWDIRQINEN